MRPISSIARRRFHCVAALTAFCVVPAVGEAQDCSAILTRGIYDISRQRTDVERAESFVNWFNENTFHSYEFAKNTGLGVNVSLDKLLLGLDFTNDRSGYEEFRKTLANYDASSETFRGRFVSEVQNINPGVVDAWKACTTRDGMHLWLEYTDDPRSVVVYGRYVDDGSNAKPKLDDFTLENISTPGGPFSNREGKRAKLTFRGSTVSQTLTIADPRQRASLNINVSVGRALNKTFAARPPRIRFAAEPATIWLEDSTVLAWSVSGATLQSIDEVSSTELQQGRKTIAPRSSRSYTLTALMADKTEVYRTVSVKVDTAVLESAIVRWTTSKFKKEWNTQPRVAVFDKDGATIIDWGCCSAARPGRHRPNDEWSKGRSEPRPIPEHALLQKRVPKSRLLSGRLLGTTNAKKPDTWEYTIVIDLIFSDGTHIVRQAKGTNTAEIRW